jgi:hypothetical protein
MEPKEILIRARKLIQNSKNWCKGSFEVNSAYCATGSLFAAGIDGWGPYMDHPSYRALAKAMNVPVGEVCVFNDGHAHEEVLAAFDRAIKSFD